ncbi:MAG: inner membrane CreD family protein, partial [Burkholderiales bacterium]
MKFPLLGKTLAVGGVLIALTLSLQSISAIVAEREGRLHEAERSVADSLASQQTLLGPVLLRRCDETWSAEQGEGKDRKLVTEKREITLAAVPDTLDVNAKAAIETRHRGIFNVNGYAMKATLKARWADLAGLDPAAQHAGGRVHCEAPTLFVAVGDARGIRVATISVGGSALPVLPGTEHTSHPRGFHAVIPPAVQSAGGVLQAEVALDLVGTGDLAFAPVADTTRVELVSDWPHPSFAGRFLPNDRTVTAQGFTASWRLSALATSAPQELLNGGMVCGLNGASEGKARCVETFGVAFMDPVSAYVLSDRATKY